MKLTSPSDPSGATSSATAGIAAPLSVPAGITQTIRDNKPAPTLTKPRPNVTSKDNAAYQEEKARILFAKYGLTLEPGEWKIPATPGVPRVEKRVRIRVHRTCHRCATAFGSDRVCSNCNHNRCKKCPGLPISKQPAAKDKGVAAGGIAGASGLKESAGAVTANPLEKKTPTQRVRRTCHECGTDFAAGASNCGNCNHKRCAQCTRDPYVPPPRETHAVSLTCPRPRKQRTTAGGDTTQTSPMARRDMNTSRMNIRWNCEKCQAKSSGYANFCANCGHKKCDNCPREPSQKVKRAAEEDSGKGLEENMKNLNVSPQASAA